MDIQAKARALAELIKRSRRAVFFGGAGVSTESGIPDFRSAEGLYAGKQRIPPETLLSRSFFYRYPEEFYTFYRDKMLYPDAQPNAAHRALAKWESQGRLGGVITQNIDGLHQAAGSQRVYELHGSVHRNHCTGCGKAYPLKAILDLPTPPHCDCGALLKPDVVLYEEPLDQQVVRGALKAIQDSDLLIVGGTSLRVYPAAGFVEGYRGKLAIVNKGPTAMDGAADLVVDAPIGELLALTDQAL